MFAANAPVALRVALHLKERYGADWQQRVALMSIDDSEWAELAGMTTIRQPTYDIGRRAVEFLHERLEGARMPARECLLPGELVVRASHAARQTLREFEWSVYRRSSCLTIATLLIAALPVVLYRKLRPRFGFERREVILGIAVFAFFSMIVERALHGFVLSNATTVGWLANPAVFVVYGALAAGVCEEVGRFIAMKWLIARASRATLDDRGHRRSATASGMAGRRRGSSACSCSCSGSSTRCSRTATSSTSTSRACRSNALMRLHMVLGSLSPQYAALFVVERAAAFVFQLGFSVLMWQMLRERFRSTLPFADRRARADRPAGRAVPGARDSAPRRRCRLSRLRR